MFKREVRYRVIKLKHLTEEQRQKLDDLCDEVNTPPRDYVVIESDWPEYETVWAMIQARMEGSPHPEGHMERDGLAEAARKAMEPNWPASVDPMARHVYRVTYDYYGAEGAWFEFEGTWRGLVNVLGTLGDVKKLDLYRHFKLGARPAEEEIPSAPALAADLELAHAEIERLREALAAGEDMAAVGESLMEAIADNIKSGPLEGWAPADGPAEVVVDLLNMIYDRDMVLKAANTLLCQAHDRIHALPRTSDTDLARSIGRFRAENSELLRQAHEACALLENGNG